MQALKREGGGRGLTGYDWIHIRAYRAGDVSHDALQLLRHVAGRLFHLLLFELSVCFSLGAELSHALSDLFENVASEAAWLRENR